MKQQMLERYQGREFEVCRQEAVEAERARIREWAEKKKEATKVYASVYEITAGTENAVLDELLELLKEAE